VDAEEKQTAYNTIIIIIICHVLVQVCNKKIIKSPSPADVIAEPVKGTGTVDSKSYMLICDIIG